MRFDPSQTVLAGLSPSTLQAWLSQAQTAYMQLMTGGKPVTVSYDGKNVTYEPTDVQKIESFIALLQRQLGINHGRRALRPYFR